MRLKNYKTLLIGAASGIGRQTALAYAREGARVAIVDINEREGFHTVQLIEDEGGAAQFIAGDVTHDDQLHHAIVTAEVFLGGVDVLANFAGLQRAGIVENFSVKDWEEIFTVNVRSQFLAAKYALPFLRQSAHGSIINMASIAGIKGGPGLTAYSASKGAIIAFTRALAAELAPKIRVNSVSPGWIDTPFNQAAIDFMHGIDRLNKFVSQTVPLQRQGVPQEIAPAFVFLASEDASYMTGHSLVIDGGLL